MPDLSMRIWVRLSLNHYKLYRLGWGSALGQLGTWNKIEPLGGRETLFSDSLVVKMITTIIA